MKLLFIAGSGRTGTTALAKYLNQHEEILIGIERYKDVLQQIDSSRQAGSNFFTFDRLLSYDPQDNRERNTAVEYHAELLAKKDPTKLKWVGDKTPGYVYRLPNISQDNPGASFILTYRPIEEVAESHEAKYELRSLDPQDSWLKGRSAFELGVRNWNHAMRNIRKFMESSVNSNVLIISYHDFFYRNEECIPLISRFLNLEFDESVREAWRETSRKFEAERRQKKPLSKEQLAFIEERKDYASEEWVLSRIEEQWRELDVSPNAGRGASSQRQGAAGIDLERERAEARIQTRVARNLERRVEMLQNSLAKERRKIKRLEKKNQKRKRQIQDLQGSRSWKLLNKIGRI